MNNEIWFWVVIGFSVAAIGDWVCCALKERAKDPSEKDPLDMVEEKRAMVNAVCVLFAWLVYLVLSGGAANG